MMEFFVGGICLCQCVRTVLYPILEELVPKS